MKQYRIELFVQLLYCIFGGRQSASFVTRSDPLKNFGQVKIMTRKLLLFVVLVVGLSNPVSAQRQNTSVSEKEVLLNWPTFGGNAARTGYGKGIGIKQKPAVKWTYNTRKNRQFPVGQLSALVMNENRVFFASEHSLFALSARRGKLLWKFDHFLNDTNRDAQNIMVTNGSVYLYGGSDDLLSLDTKTGKEKWRYELNRKDFGGAIPVVNDNQVFFVSKNGFIYALSIENGKKRWKQRLKLRHHSKKQHSPVRRTVVGASVSEGEMYVSRVAFHNGNHPNLYGLSTQNGKRLWSKYVEGEIQGAPVMKNQTVYVVTATMKRKSGKLLAISSKYGKTKWSISLKERIYHAPAVAEGMLYFGTSKGGVYAVDAENGSLIWKRKLGKRMTCSPTIVGNVMYLGGPRYLYALSIENGKVYWRLKMEGAVKATAPVGEMIFVGTKRKSSLRVYALMVE